MGGARPAAAPSANAGGVKRLLLRESQVQPLLVVFEDLHWIDSETQALLDGLVESLPTARLLLLVNYRPEYQHAWGGKTYYRQLRLDPLPPESAEELLEALLGSDRRRSAAQAAADRSGPRATRSSSRRASGRWSRPGRSSASGAPTVWCKDLRDGPGAGDGAGRSWPRASTACRPRTSGSSRRPRSSARTCPFALLQAIAEHDPRRRCAAGSPGSRRRSSSTRRASSRISSTRSSTRSPTRWPTAASSRSGGARSTHGSSTPSRSSIAERLAEHVERLAHHAFRGEDWEKAVTYLRQAGAKAVARVGASARPSRTSSRLWPRSTHLPTTRDATRSGRRHPPRPPERLYPWGSTAARSSTCRPRAALAEEMGDPIRLIRVAGYLADDVRVLRRLRSSTRRDAAPESWRHARTTRSSRSRSDLRSAQTYIYRGEFAKATPLVADVLRAADGGGPAPRFFGQILTSVQAHGYLAWCLGEQGHSPRPSTPRSAVSLKPSAKSIDTAKPSYAVWVASSTSARVISKRRGACWSRPWSSLAAWSCRWSDCGTIANLGLTYAYRGAVEAGLALLEEARERNPVLLAEGYLVAHRFDEARTTARRALEDARQVGEVATVARASWLLGAAATALDPPAVAEAIEATIEMPPRWPSELGMRPLVAHCHLGLGKLYGRTGNASKPRSTSPPRRRCTARWA